MMIMIVEIRKKNVQEDSRHHNSSIVLSSLPSITALSLLC